MFTVVSLLVMNDVDAERATAAMCKMIIDAAEEKSREMIEKGEAEIERARAKTMSAEKDKISGEVNRKAIDFCL